MRLSDGFIFSTITIGSIPMHGGGTEQKKNHYIALADPREGRDASPGPNSFVFMQFAPKKLQNNTNLGVGALTSGKVRICHYIDIHREDVVVAIFVSHFERRPLPEITVAKPLRGSQLIADHP